MRETPEASPEGDTAADPNRSSQSDRRSARHGAFWWIGWGLGAITLVFIAAAVGVWLRLSIAPLTLPDMLHDRIEARLDAAMNTGVLEIGDMALDLPEGGRAPVVEFRDVRLRDPDGAPRAAFPAVRVQLDAGHILSGSIRPRRVEIAGAGLLLSRDQQGQFDLDLSGATGPAEVTLPETMARLDEMFASPIFGGLQEVTATGLRLSMADAMTDQTLQILDATARLTQTEDQLTLTVGGALEGTRDSRLDLAILRRAADAETEMAAVFSNLAALEVATVSPALAWLDLMRAPISGRLALQLSDDGAVGDLQARLNIGQGTVSLGPNGASLGFDRIAADMAYEPETRRLTFSTLRLDAPDVSFAAEGYADVDETGTSFVTQFRASEIATQAGALFDAPRSIEGGAVDLRLTLSPTLRIEVAQATLFDDTLRVHADGLVEAQDDGLVIAIDASVPETDVETVLRFWPETALPNTRRFVDRQMDEATLHGVDFAWRSGPGASPQRMLQMSLSEVVMRPLRRGPPIQGAVGLLELDDTRLTVRLDAGTIAGEGGGPVDLSGTTMVVEEVGPRGPEAQFRVAGRGALKDVLTFLDGPPFDIFRDGTITPARIGTGAAEVVAEFQTRLMPRETPATLAELGLRATASIRGFASDDLVPGRPLRADRLTVDLAPERLTVSGPAEISGVPVTGTWQRPLGGGATPGSRLEARAVLDRDGLASLGVDLPEWLMSGRGAAELQLDLPDGAPGLLRVSSDLAGLGLAIPALGWRMSQSATGALEAVVTLGDTPDVTTLNLSGPDLALEGDVALLPDNAGLGRLTVDRLRVGGWLDVAGALIGRGAGIPPAVEITGGRLSLTDAPSLGGRVIDPNAAGVSVPLTVRLNQVGLGTDLALTDVTGIFDAGLGLEGEFEARVNGEAEIAGVLNRGQFGPSVQILATDGGAVLRSAGIFQSAYGGRMQLGLEARQAPQSFDGRLRIEGPRLRDAPAMAELLNLISVVGLLEQLGGDGINLGTVDARFRLSPGRLDLLEGTAVGPSLGLSLDGIYDTTARRFDMQGVVSPLYIVNGLVGALFAPRREGLFGFSYTLTGTAERSNVSVNPLSILTPGVFREVFRRPPPELTELETQ